MTSLDDKLEKVHAQMQELLKFAETKNAGLLAFNGIIILEGVKNIYEHKDALETYQLTIALYILLLNIISFLICLSSFFPNRQTKPLRFKKNISNLLFYGSISTHSPSEYLEAFQKRYESKPENRNFCMDITRQIIIQSQILVDKFSKFEVASVLTFVAFGSPLAYLAYKIYFRKKEDSL